MDYHTVIVGAGPAGLKAAETLAKAGKRVLVLEKNKIIGDKICAGGLTPMVHKYGIPRKIMDRTFREVFFYTPTQKAVMKIGKIIGYTVDRKKLGAFMAKQAGKSGAEIRTSTEVTKIGKDFVVAKGKKIKFKWLIGADGVQSIVRKHLGLRSLKKDAAFQYRTKKYFKNLEIFTDVDRFGISYAWIFPHKGYSLVGCGVNTAHTDFSTLKRNFDEWCRTRFDLDKAEFQAWSLNYDYQGHEFGNKFLAGEAAGLVSGLTGEGMYPSMLSGVDIANKILDKYYYCENLERWLKRKKLHDFFVATMEKSRLAAKAEYWALAKMIGSRWCAPHLVKRLE